MCAAQGWDNIQMAHSEGTIEESFIKELFTKRDEGQGNPHCLVKHPGANTSWTVTRPIEKISCGRAATQQEVWL